MNKKILLTMLLALLALPFTACKEDDDNTHFNVPSDAMWSIVTLEATGNTGTVFSFRKDGDSELITLICNNNISSMGLAEHARILIAYMPSSGIAYTSGPITLYGVALLNGTITKVGPASAYSAWASDPIDMLALQRSGEYINVTATAYFYKTPRFTLVIDETTLDDEIPVAHLIFTADNPVNQTFHTLYGSFDISKAWERETCKGIKVEYQASAGRTDKTFMKHNGPLTPSTPDE